MNLILFWMHQRLCFCRHCWPARSPDHDSQPAAELPEHDGSAAAPEPWFAQFPEGGHGRANAEHHGSVPTDAVLSGMTVRCRTCVCRHHLNSPGISSLKLSRLFSTFNSEICSFPHHLPTRYQWGMKTSRWCSSSTSSRWWYQSASLCRDPCLSTTVLLHLHNRIAQGEPRRRSSLVQVQLCAEFRPLTTFLSCSPSVGYLQAPSSEQYQITPSPSPCNPQQLQQQYSGMTSPTGTVQFGWP